jgi:hypothetical protein
MQSRAPVKAKGFFIIGFFGLILLYRPGAAEDAKNRYDYWAQFKPGTSVTFLIRTKGGGADQEILKTFAIKQVTPQSILIIFHETLPSGAAARSANQGGLLSGTLNFAAHETPAADADLLGSQLNFDPFKAWEKEAGAEVDREDEALLIQGTRIDTKRTRINLKAPGVTTTIILWRSEKVPGTIVKGTRELRLPDRNSFKEEFSAVEFRVSLADPAEIARLRADRKPEMIEESGSEFVDGYFRFNRDVEAASRIFKTLLSATSRLVPGSPDTDWAIAGKEWSRFWTAAQAIQDHLAEDRKRVGSMLVPAEFKKLDAFLKEADALPGYYYQQAEFIRSLSEILANLPEKRPTSEQLDSLREYSGTLNRGFQTALSKISAEFVKLIPIKIQSIR